MKLQDFLKKHLVSLIACFIAVIAIVIAIVIALLLNNAATDENPQGLQFYLQDDGTYIVSCGDAKHLSSIVIPNTYKGGAVVGIDNSAFLGCSNLTSVVIPDSVTSIGASAFSGCSSLTSVVIPDNVTSIGVWAFNGCSSLSQIIVDTGNNNYSSIDGNLYSKDAKVLIQYAIGKKDSEFCIPNSVTSIGNYAFLFCSSLTSVVIPDSVTSIGVNAFYDCSSLTSVVIGDSVTSIGDSAFSWCSSLTSVVIGDSVTSIGDSAFSDCSSLTSVVIPDSVTSIGDYAFCECSNLTSVVIGDSVTSIGDLAFAACSSLNQIIVENGNNNYSSIDGNLYSKDVKVLIQYAAGKTNPEFYIPDSVTSIGNGVFVGCSSLTSVVIPDGVTYIGVAFYDCTSLTDVYYTGSEEEWAEILSCLYNEELENATIHYNYVPEE